jgi:hypothetical protein
VIPSPVASPEPASTAAVAQASEPAEIKSTRVLIPSIDVDALIIDLALRRDGTVHVPWGFRRHGLVHGPCSTRRGRPQRRPRSLRLEDGPAVFYDLRPLETET